MDQPVKVSVSQLESEFGLEGNTSAAESDAVADVAAGAVHLDEVEQETTELHGIDTKAIEQQITQDEALAGLDDNLARMEKQAELDAMAEEGDDDDDDQEDEEPVAAAKEEKPAEKPAEKAEAKDAETKDEEKPADPAEEEDAADDDGDPLVTWVQKNLEAEEDRDAMASALMESDARIPVTSHGKTELLTLKEVAQRAAGYAGQSVVDRKLAEAQTIQASAKKAIADAEEAKVAAQRTVESVTAEIDDYKKFGTFIVDRANVDYMKGLHGILEAAIERAETDPHGFDLSRRMIGIEEKLDKLGSARSDGAAPKREVGQEDDDTPKGDPAGAVPDDLGFIRGQGYPDTFAKTALRDMERLLEGAEASGGPKVTAREVLDAWKGEGRTRQVTDVARGLLASKARDHRKVKIANAPPKRKTSTGTARPRTGQKPAGNERPAKVPAWDDIEKEVAREVARANQQSEL